MGLVSDDISYFFHCHHIIGQLHSAAVSGATGTPVGVGVAVVHGAGACIGVSA